MTHGPIDMAKPLRRRAIRKRRPSGELLRALTSGYYAEDIADWLPCRIMQYAQKARGAAARRAWAYFGCKPTQSDVTILGDGVADRNVLEVMYFDYPLMSRVQVFPVPEDESHLSLTEYIDRHVAEWGAQLENDFNEQVFRLFAVLTETMETVAVPSRIKAGDADLPWPGWNFEFTPMLLACMKLAKGMELALVGEVGQVLIGALAPALAVDAGTDSTYVVPFVLLNAGAWSISPNRLPTSGMHAAAFRVLEAPGEDKVSPGLLEGRPPHYDAQFPLHRPAAMTQQYGPLTVSYRTVDLPGTPLLDSLYDFEDEEQLFPVPEGCRLLGEGESAEPGDLIYRRPRHAWEPGGKWVRLREVAPGFRPTPNLVIARRA